MKLTFNTKALKAALTYVGSAIVENPIIPVCENVLISLANDKATLTGADMKNSRATTVIDYVNETPTITSGVALLPYKHFKDIVTKSLSASITLELDFNKFGHVLTFQKSKYKVTGENPKDYPKGQEAEKDIQVVTFSGKDKDDFLAGLTATVFACSKDELRPAMTGVLFSMETEKYTLVSTDGHLLSQYTVPRGTDQPRNVILPAPFVQVVRKLIETYKAPLTLLIGPRNIRAIVADYSTESPLIDQTYPDWRGVIRETSKFKFDIDSLELKTALNRLLVVADKTTKQVRFSFTGEVLTISAEDEGYGNSGDETLTVSSNLPEEKIVFGVIATKMLDTLLNIDSETIVLNVDADNRALLIESSDPFYLGLVMPCLLNPVTKIY